MTIDEKKMGEILELAEQDCEAMLHFAHVPVCQWHCLPCARVMELGKCQWMQEMMRYEK